MTPVDVRAVTFNVFHDYPRCRHIDRRLALLEDALAREAPQIAVLQEISVSLLHGNLAERLVSALRSRGLAYELHYAAANGSIARGEVFEEGSAILSRWPIRDVAVRRLAEPLRRQQHGYEFEEIRVAVAATVRSADGVEIEVVGAHLTDLTPSHGEASARRAQIEDLHRFVVERSAGRDAVVGGDFNARPDSPEIRWLRANGFVDVCESVDPGPTNDPADRDLEAPAETASHRIDHLFVLPGGSRPEVHGVRLFLAEAVEIEPGRHLWASDHNGIVADLTIPGS